MTAGGGVGVVKQRPWKHGSGSNDITLFTAKTCYMTNSIKLFIIFKILALLKNTFRCVFWIPTAKALQLRIPVYKSTIYQGCTNPGRQVAVATDFYMVATNICGSSAWNLIFVTFLAPKIVRWLTPFWKICAPLV